MNSVQTGPRNNYGNAFGPSAMASAQERARNPRNSYEDKDFGYLIDTEKRPFVLRRLVQTFSGGYRLRKGDEDSLHWSLHVLQILPYGIVPAIVLAVFFSQSIPI